ncbi:hypothetical protein TWF696_008265 [Orbilia brochopaga]|uniref:Uncharacterized protein n=1 Tax=Orbilia brochopaga TaxID=3140254 RepID=A0AAV9UKV9_9PEZI
MSDDSQYTNFDTDGKWNPEKAIGPAIHTPRTARDAIVTEYRIEWLEVSVPPFYSKNHMAASVVFADRVQSKVGGL